MASKLLKKRYIEHWFGARARDISFELTFDEWLSIWTASGHLHERGRHKGNYVMARHGDVGAYAIGNVKIVRQEDNHREALKGREKSPEHRAKLSARSKAFYSSPENRAKLSARMKEVWQRP